MTLHDLNECKTHLVARIRSTYFAYWLVRTNTLISDKVPTAGVRYTGRRFELMVNPTFFDSLNFDQKCFLIEHELYHLVCGHVFNHKSKKHENRYEDKHLTLLNIAKDICINQWCEPKGMIEGGMLPETFGFPKNLTSLEYYDLLLKSDKVQFVTGYAAGENFFEDDSGEEGITAEQMHESMSKTAYHSNPGTLPGEVQQIIDEIKRKSKINWKKILRQYLGMVPADTKFRRKYNKKHNPEYVVKKRLYKKRLLIGIDVSGSISPEEINVFFNEIDAVYKEGEIDVVCCDTQITEQFKYTGQRPKSVKGGGGTILQPICDVYHQGNYNALIVFTDGYIGEVTCTKSSLWLYTQEKNFTVYGNGKKIPFDLSI